MCQKCDELLKSGVDVRELVKGHMGKVCAALRPHLHEIQNLHERLAPSGDDTPQEARDFKLMQAAMWLGIAVITLTQHPGDEKPETKVRHTN